MKIVRIEEQGKFHYPNQDELDRKKKLIRLDYYRLVIKTKCGNHRVDIHPNIYPRVFRMIRDEKLKVGQNLIFLIETHMPREL